MPELIKEVYEYLYYNDDCVLSSQTPNSIDYECKLINDTGDEFPFCITKMPDYDGRQMVKIIYEDKDYIVQAVPAVIAVIVFNI